jgi:hypothetical protein
MFATAMREGIKTGHLRPADFASKVIGLGLAMAGKHRQVTIHGTA